MKRIVPLFLSLCVLLFSCKKELLEEEDGGALPSQPGDRISFFAGEVAFRADLQPNGQEFLWNVNDELSVGIKKGTGNFQVDKFTTNVDYLDDKKAIFESDTLTWGEGFEEYQIYFTCIGGSYVTPLTNGSTSVKFPLPDLSTQVMDLSDPMKHINRYNTMYGTWKGHRKDDRKVKFGQHNAMIEFRIMVDKNLSADEQDIAIQSIRVDNVFEQSFEGLSPVMTGALAYSGAFLKGEAVNGEPVISLDASTATPKNSITLTFTNGGTAVNAPVTQSADHLSQRLSGHSAGSDMAAYPNTLVARVMINPLTMNASVGGAVSDKGTNLKITVNTTKGTFIFYKNFNTSDLPFEMKEGQLFLSTIVLQSRNWYGHVDYEEEPEGVRNRNFVGYVHAQEFSHHRDDRVFYKVKSGDMEIALNGPLDMQRLIVNVFNWSSVGMKYESGRTYTARQMRDFDMQGIPFMNISLPQYGKLIYDGQGYMLKNLVVKGTTWKSSGGLFCNAASSQESVSIIRNLQIRGGNSIGRGYRGSVIGTGKRVFMEGVVVDDFEVRATGDNPEATETALAKSNAAGLVGASAVVLNACYYRSPANKPVTGFRAAAGLVSEANNLTGFPNRIYQSVSHTDVQVLQNTSVPPYNKYTLRAAGIVHTLNGQENELVIASYATGNIYGEKNYTYPDQKVMLGGIFSAYTSVATTNIVASFFAGTISTIADPDPDPAVYQVGGLAGAPNWNKFRGCYWNAPDTAVGTKWPSLQESYKFSETRWPKSTDLSADGFGDPWTIGSAPTLTGGGWWATLGSYPANYPKLAVESYFEAALNRSLDLNSPSAPVVLPDPFKLEAVDPPVYNAL